MLLIAYAATTLLGVAPGGRASGHIGDDDPEGGSNGASIFPVQPAWTTDLGHAPAAAPAYDEFHAYVPLRDGTLSAVRLRDGEVAWSIDQPTVFPPLPGEGTVIVADETSLVALRVTDGQPLWVLDFERPISATPLRQGGWLLVALTGAELVVLRATDGHEYWRRSFDAAPSTRPSLGGARIFVPVADGRLVTLDLLTGTPIWERVIGGSLGEVLPLDSLFIGSTNNSMYRLSRDDGTVQWRWRTGGDIVGLPVVDEDWLYFASLDNMLYALDRDSGVQQWRRPLPARPRAGPTLIGDVLFVSGVSQRLRTFSRKTGQPFNTLSAPGELGASPYLDASLDPIGLRMVAAGLVDADCVMWCDDYPHGASTWPESQAVIAETMAGLTAADKRKITHDNVAALYGIDVVG